jgi:hypothetical protein
MRELFVVLTAVFGTVMAMLPDEQAVLKPAPDQISESPQIIFPTIPVIDEKDIPEEDLPIPVPRPKRGPEFVSALTEDTLLVIESTSPLMVFDFPEGLVSVEADDGARPMKVKSKFADGTGKMESRTFTSKYLYFVEALKKGEVEMLIIPEGAINKTQSQRHKITVMGLSPIPPPGPGPTPEPDPVPVPTVTSFRVIFVKESGSTLNASQSSIPAAKVIRDYLAAKTTLENGQPSWREYDPDQSTTNEQPTMRKLWEAVKPSVSDVPCLVIEVNGHATVMPFPANVDECMATLKKAAGE